MTERRPGDFKGTKGKLDGAVGHHLGVAGLIDDESEWKRLYTALQAVDPATSRSYFDVTNRSDNVVHLLQPDGTGSTSVNGTVVHAGNHPTYSQFVTANVAPKVRDTFLANGGSINE